MRGTVKWFNDEKGYGFIAPESGGKDVFIHMSALRDSRIQTLAEGQQIEFDMEPGKKGQQAVNITTL